MITIHTFANQFQSLITSNKIVYPNLNKEVAITRKGNISIQEDAGNQITISKN